MQTGEINMPLLQRDGQREESNEREGEIKAQKERLIDRQRQQVLDDRL